MLGCALCLLVSALLGAGQRPRPAASVPPSRGAARLLWRAALDVNQEAERSFEALPGIGPMRARAIVLGRPFCSVSDLDRVAGIGPETLRRLRGRVTMGEPPAACGERGD